MGIDDALNHPDLGHGLLRLVEETRVPAEVLARSAKQMLARYDGAGTDGVGRYALWQGIEHGIEVLELLRDAEVLVVAHPQGQGEETRYLLQASKLEEYLVGPASSQ